MKALDVIRGERQWAVDCADAIDWLYALPDGALDLLVCSPPYEQARLYLEEGEDLGIARDTEAWVAWMVEVCRAARRACKGLCAFVVEGQTRDYCYTCSPFLLLADLRRQGFHLRKPPLYVRDGIPGSGGPDWLKNCYEPIVCITRGGRLPWSDPTATGHPPRFKPGGAMSNRLKDGSRVTTNGTPRKPNGDRERQGYIPPELANPGNLIDCGPAGGGRLGSELAHLNEAPFPERLVEVFIRSFCSPGGIVGDCFSGSGSTAAVAVRWGRRFAGCDLRQSQVDLTHKRLDNETPYSLFAEESQ